jgi:deoxycytidylate deaminase
LNSRIDLTNRIFGSLTVLRAGPGRLIGQKKPKLRTSWICRCGCGKESDVLTTNLIRGNSTSCGCVFANSQKYNFKDLSGQKYGQLKVLSLCDEKTKTRGALWQCQCDCGNIVKLASNSLTSGNSVTCGDKKKHLASNLILNRCGEIPLAHLIAIKNNAIKRNLRYEVTPEYLWNVFLLQDRKCAISGIPLTFSVQLNSSVDRTLNTTASLDRINSKLGYLEGNVQWTHKDINKMKSNHTIDYFLELCRLSYLNQYSLKDRPSFDEYFTMLSVDVSLRSEDRHIKHGAVIVDNRSQHILGTGYNATIRGSNKEIINLDDREGRRPWMIHAEENAILNCSRNPLELSDGASIYVSGPPCVNCLQRIVNFGITKVVHVNRVATITENEASEKMRQQILQMSTIEVNTISPNNKWIKRALL